MRVAVGVVGWYEAALGDEGGPGPSLLSAAVVVVVVVVVGLQVSLIGFGVLGSPCQCSDEGQGGDGQQGTPHGRG